MNDATPKSENGASATSEGDVRESWKRDDDDLQCIKCGFVTKSEKEFDYHSPCKDSKRKREVLIAEIVHLRHWANKRHTLKMGGRIRPVDGHDLMVLFTFPLDELEQCAKLCRQFEVTHDVPAFEPID